MDVYSAYLEQLIPGNFSDLKSFISTWYTFRTWKSLAKSLLAESNLPEDLNNDELDLTILIQAQIGEMPSEFTQLFPKTLTKSNIFAFLQSSEFTIVRQYKLANELNTSFVWNNFAKYGLSGNENVSSGKDSPQASSIAAYAWSAEGDVAVHKYPNCVLLNTNLQRNTIDIPLFVSCIYEALSAHSANVSSLEGESNSKSGIGSESESDSFFNDNPTFIDMLRRCRHSLSHPTLISHNFHLTLVNSVRSYLCYVLLNE